MTNLSYPPKLKAMSVHAPFAYAICMGLKTHEYRTKPTSMRGWILIHSSKSTTSDEYFDYFGINLKQAKRGALIGAVKITDSYETAQEHIYCLDSGTLFKKPVLDIAGSQSIFWGSTTPEREKAFGKAWKQLNEVLPPIYGEGWIMNRVFE